MLRGRRAQTPACPAAFASKAEWAERLRAAGLTVQVAPDQLTDLRRVEFAICWEPEPGLLQRVRPQGCARALPVCGSPRGFSSADGAAA